MVEEKGRKRLVSWFPLPSITCLPVFLSYNTVKLNSTNGMADWDSLIGYLDYIVDPELWVSNADL
jgi:hypothetical protein